MYYLKETSDKFGNKNFLASRIAIKIFLKNLKRLLSRVPSSCQTFKVMFAIPTQVYPFSSIVYTDTLLLSLLQINNNKNASNDEVALYASFKMVKC